MAPGGREAEPSATGPAVLAEVLAALAYGERRGATRAQDTVRLAPDARARSEQQGVADRERENCDLIEARLKELGEEALMERFRPFFDAFFEHTEPSDWIEAQTFDYVSDALVSDFADVLVPLMDRVSGELVRRALGDRESQEGFALDELTPREQEVLQLMLAGKSNQEIAHDLFIVEGTVKSHVNSILAKLGVTDRTQAVTTALKRGLVRLT